MEREASDASIVPIEQKSQIHRSISTGKSHGLLLVYIQL